MSNHSTSWMLEQQMLHVLSLDVLAYAPRGDVVERSSSLSMQRTDDQSVRLWCLIDLLTITRALIGLLCQCVRVDRVDRMVIRKIQVCHASS